MPQAHVTPCPPCPPPTATGPWPGARAALAAGLCLLLAACQTAPGLRGTPAQAPASTGAAAAEPLREPPPDPTPAAPPPAASPPPPPAQAEPLPAQAEGPADASTRSDLWGRIRQGMGIPPLTRGEAGRLQAQHARWYERNGEHMRRVFSRARLYMHDIVEAVQAEGLPMEVALLPAVESAFMPDAVSSAAADGLWQFIRSTGKHYGLQQHAFVDQRRDVRQATRAALAFLKDLQARYEGDMQLALAAYNCGPGCIDTAVRRARAQGKAGRFEDLRLNAETANYVPRLLALSALVAEAVDTNTLDRHQLPDMPDAPYFTEVLITRDLDVALAARLAGQTEAEFRSLNPQHRKPVIVAQINPHVLVPVDRKEAFEVALQNYRGQMSSWTLYKVQQRSSVQAIAQRVGMEPERLRKINRIPLGHLVQAGSTLLVPRRGASLPDISARAAEGARLGTTPATVVRALRLSKQDAGKGQAWSWDVLARRLGVRPAQLKAWNPQVRHLAAGTVRLRLPVEVAERAPAPRATPPRRAAAPTRTACAPPCGG